MEAFTPPWSKSLIFLRGSLVFLRSPGLENAQFHIISAFPRKIMEFHKKCVFYHKNMYFIDLQHFGVHGPSRNTNDPLGISMVSAMGAGVPIFY